MNGGRKTQSESEDSVKEKKKTRPATLISRSNPFRVIIVTFSDTSHAKLKLRNKGNIWSVEDCFFDPSFVCVLCVKIVKFS